MNKEMIHEKFTEGWGSQCKKAKVDPIELLCKLAYISSYVSPGQYSAPTTYSSGATPFSDITGSNNWSYIGQPQAPGLFAKDRSGKRPWGAAATGAGIGLTAGPIGAVLGALTGGNLGKLQAWQDRRAIQSMQKRDPLLAQQMAIKYQRQWSGEPALGESAGNWLRGLYDPAGAGQERQNWLRANARRGRAMQMADMAAQGKDPSAIYGGVDYSSVNPFYSNPSK